MTLGPLDLAAAWLLDAAIGDPPSLPWPHPVVLMGRLVKAVEERVYPVEAGPLAHAAAGAALWLAVVAASSGTAALGLWLLGLVHPGLEWAGAVYLAYACLATRDLDREARTIRHALARRRLRAARQRLARIVGRDTTHLSGPEVARATVETVAENASDGVVAPLFYLAAGSALGLGPLLGVAYKAVNTLDSMVGYRNPRYRHFGTVSARIDDLANWLPARLTALLAAAAAALLWRRGGAAWRTARRDGGLHKSPNAGHPEAAFAGGLGCELGGPNWYGGVLRAAPRIGDPGRPLGPEHIGAALRMLWVISGGAAGAAVLTLIWFG